jgi:hypothetical protein
MPAYVIRVIKANVPFPLLETPSTSRKVSQAITNGFFQGVIRDLRAQTKNTLCFGRVDDQLVP